MLLEAAACSSTGAVSAHRHYIVGKCFFLSLFLLSFLFSFFFLFTFSSVCQVEGKGGPQLICYNVYLFVFWLCLSFTHVKYIYYTILRVILFS